MDILRESAKAFQKLLDYKYHFIIGRKGKSREFTIGFDDADFHHLAGLHKLRDNVRIQTGKRSDVFEEILSGKITLAQLEKSEFYNEMSVRLDPLSHLEEFLDDNHLIFRYNEKSHKFSLIKADYLLENKYLNMIIYLFLGERENENDQMCRTFFPKQDKDYTVGQAQYTLLKKEKIHLPDGNIEVQYDRLSKKK